MARIFPSYSRGSTAATISNPFPAEKQRRDSDSRLGPPSEGPMMTAKRAYGDLAAPVSLRAEDYFNNFASSECCRNKVANVLGSLKCELSGSSTRPWSKRTLAPTS